MYTALLSTAYLAPIHYYSKFLNHKKTIIEINDNYSKQSYRNRCIIYGANGPMNLIVPIKKGVKTKTKTKDIKIEYDINWQHIHIVSMRSSYKSSPFYDYYIDDFLKIYNKKHLFLVDQNMEFHNLICTLMEFPAETTVSEKYYKDTSGINDYRDLIHPKQKELENTYKPTPYNQVFIEKSGFIPNLSIIDLLFNEGTNATEVIKQE